MSRQRATDARGSLTVEAALIFPFFVLILAFFFSILKCAIGWFVLRSALYEVAGKMTAYSYLYEMAELDQISAGIEGNGADLSDLDLWLKQKAYQVALNALGTQIERELFEKALEGVELSALGVTDGFRGLSFGGTQVFCNYKGRSALLYLEVSYYPAFFGTDSASARKFKTTITVVSHPFLGKDPFETSETTSSEVYRIGEGDKYHILSCFLIDKNITEYSLLEAQEIGLSPCSRCRAWECARVYASKGGECYHAQGCSYLYPDLTAMSEQEAKEQGLEPCRICIKEGGWFEGNN